MGLASAHGIIKGHGGTLTVKSTVGAGSTFTVLLPRPDAAERALSPPRHSDIVLRVRTASTETGRKRVLVVEADASIRHATAQMLERAGFDTATCASPEEALSMVLRSPDLFDAAIVDGQSLDGVPAAASATLRDMAPHLPIVLTTSGSRSTTTEGLSDEIAIAKPFTAKDVLRAVEAAIQSR